MLPKIRRSVSLNDFIPQTIRELRKKYSRLELVDNRLRGRDKALFEICKSSLEKGQEEHAAIYASEIAEIRNILSVTTSTRLVLEQVITRLETIKEICPTIKEIRGLFGDVQNVLKLLTEIMPVMTPELDALSNVVTEILSTTQAGPVTPIEPIVVKDASTEAILREASGIVEEELMKKIPEPPVVTSVSSPGTIGKPMIAVTTSGPGIYQKVMQDPSVASRQNSQPTHKDSNSLSEELVLDYIYRNKGETDIAQCAEELGMSQNEVLSVLDLLSTKGKIRIEQ